MWVFQQIPDRQREWVSRQSEFDISSATLTKNILDLTYHLVGIGMERNFALHKLLKKSNDMLSREKSFFAIENCQSVTENTIADLNFSVIIDLVGTEYAR